MLSVSCYNSAIENARAVLVTPASVADINSGLRSIDADMAEHSTTLFPPTNTDSKVCNKCHERKPTEDFRRCARLKDGRASTCKACAKNKDREYQRRYCERHAEARRERSRAYREANREKVRAASLAYHHKRKTEQPEEHTQKRRHTWLKRKYGITADQYNDLFQKQSGLCAVCGKPEPGRAGYLHVDHDHATGRRRGLLCQACNVALGCVNDDPAILRALITYLELHQNNADVPEAAPTATNQKGESQ